VCSVGFLIGGLAIGGLPTPQIGRRPTGASALREQGAVLSYFRDNFVFAFHIGMSFFSSFFGISRNHMMPVFAVDILEVGSFGLGAMMAMSGTGAVAGLLAIGYAGDVENKGALFIGGATIFGGFIILFSASTFFPLSLVAILCMGFAGSVY